MSRCPPPPGPVLAGHVSQPFPLAKRSGSSFALFFGAAFWLQILGLTLTHAQSIDRALSYTDSGYVDLGDPGDAFDFAPGGERTYAFWVRNDSATYHVKLLDKYRRADDPEKENFGYSIFSSQFAGTLGLYIAPHEETGGYSTHGVAGTHNISDGEWHHVAIVQIDSLLLAYIDGRQDFSYVMPVEVKQLVSDTPLWLGWNDRAVIHFTGDMDELSIWHRGLSQSEIHRLMYSRPEPGTADLTAYWSFDGDDPVRLSDRSGNGHRGTLIGVNRITATRPLAPPFRETIWFYLLAGLAAAAGLVAVNFLFSMRLRARNRQLESLVGERTQAVEQQAELLARQADELKALDETKSRLFANVSHEFRTPLTLSIGPLQDLRKLLLSSPESNAEASKLVEQALLNNLRLLRLVTQLLDVARVEAHRLTLVVRPVELQPYLDSIAQAFAGLAERNRIIFERQLPAAPLTIYADPEHLEKVVTNLLSNAFKFTTAGGTIELGLDANDTHARIAVRDTGVGIPEDELPHVFDRFYQTQAGLRGQEVGTGIGLALVRELVALHGGSVSVTSKEGVGTTFVAELPFGSVHFANRPEVTLSDEPLVITTDRGLAVDVHPVSSGSNGHATDDAEDRTTILVVDDNAEIRAYVRKHLDAHFRVTEAADGRDALTLARVSPPDAIVSDVMMPNLDGLGLLKALREDPDLDFVPVVLLTARAELSDRLEGLGLGADDYLTKPFDVEELLARLHNLIAVRHRLQQETKTASASAPAPEEAQSDDAVFLTWFKETVDANLGDEAFGVDTLAEMLGVSRRTLYRRLGEALDQTPADYLRTARLDRGAELLRAHVGNVSEIAYAVGFKSVPHFVTSFRTHIGQTPAIYAAEHAA